MIKFKICLWTGKYSFLFKFWCFRLKSHFWQEDLKGKTPFYSLQWFYSGYSCFYPLYLCQAEVSPKDWWRSQIWELNWKSNRDGFKKKLSEKNYCDLHHLKGVWNLPHQFHLYLILWTYSSSFSKSLGDNHFQNLLNLIYFVNYCSILLLLAYELFTSSISVLQKISNSTALQ